MIHTVYINIKPLAFGRGAVAPWYGSSDKIYDRIALDFQQGHITI